MITLAELAIWAQIESDLKSELDIALIPVRKRPREACVVYGENPSTEIVTLRRTRNGYHYLSAMDASDVVQVATKAIGKIRSLVPQI